MGDNYIFKVDSETLKQQADAMTGYVNEIKKDFDGIRQLVKKSGIYWQGEASRRHCQIFEENEEDIAQILKRLGEHPVDLKKMAGVYEQAEQLNEIQASSLREDVL